MKRTLKPIDPVMEILLHALGLQSPFFAGDRYRNHYVAQDGHPLLERMVAARLMERGRTMNGQDEDRDRVYFVSAGGVAVVNAFVRTVPRETRDQKRYSRWLRASDAYPDLSFKEWLKLPAEERGCP